MIRKQLYISQQHDRKLKELAAEWDCSEAEVVRRAIDKLPAERSLQEQIDERLRAAGLLVEIPRDPTWPQDPEESRRLREKLEREIKRDKKFYDITQAVLDNRR